MVSKVKKIAEAGRIVPDDDVVEAASLTAAFFKPPEEWLRKLYDQTREPPKTCENCSAWVRDARDNNVAAAFGGCARSGKTTSTYGEDRYVHYTTDTTSCSLWQPKED